MGGNSFSYFWTINTIKKWKNIIPKKVKFQGWLKLANFQIFFEKFRKFAARWAKKNSKINGEMPKNSVSRNCATLLKQPWNLTFFGDDIFQLFCCLNGWKVPKSKSPKTNRKHLNIPCLQALTLGHIIKNDSYSTLNCKAFCVTDSVVCFQLVLCANWSVQVLVHHAGLLILGTSYGRVLQFGHWCYVWRIHNKREPVKIQPWNNQYMRSFETCWHL